MTSFSEQNTKKSSYNLFGENGKKSYIILYEKEKTLKGLNFLNY